MKSKIKVFTILIIAITCISLIGISAPAKKINTKLVPKTTSDKIVKRKIKFKKKWKYAKYSKIHTGKAVLYKHTTGKRITIAINAGHGTKGGERYKTLCHPDGSRKLVEGSTAKGAKYSPATTSGIVLKNGKQESTATLSLTKALKNKLLKAGFNVLMIRDKSNVQLDEIARTVIANHYANCHIALHYDSTSSNKGAFFLSVPKIKSYRKMQPVKSHWKQHNAFGNAVIKGIKKKGLRVFGNGKMAMDLTQTSYSTVPSIDIEVGDRASSTTKKSQDKMAAGIAKGIKKFFKK